MSYDDELDQLFGTRGMGQEQLKAEILKLIAKAEVAARLDELKQWTDVDTVPGIPIDAQSELERMFDDMRDRIAQLKATQEGQEHE